MKDIYNFIAKKEDSTGLLFNKWSLGQLATFIDEYVGELEAKNNESLHLVSSSLRIEDFHIGFEYLQYEMDSERYLNKGMIWKKKKYGFNSPRLHKIKELIDNGEIARCNES